MAKEQIVIPYTPDPRIEKELRTAIKLWPDNVEALVAMAFLSDRAQSGVEWARRAVALEPQSGRCAYALGRTLLTDEALPSEAVSWLRKAIKLAPKLVDAHVCLGRALAQEGLHHAAIRAYDEALRLDPSNGDAAARLSISLSAVERK